MTTEANDPQQTIAAATDRPAPGSRVTAALPRSPLHLRLLRQAGTCPDVLLFRDAHLAAHMTAAEHRKAIFLGREQRWPGTPLHRARAANHAYYRSLDAVLRQWQYTRVILFLESEPLENRVRDVVGDDLVELWEEGLSHYTDFHGPFYDRLRAAIQLAAGFYPRRIFQRRADRACFAAVRDRFGDGGLPTEPPVDATCGSTKIDAALVLGAPLVQDRLVSRRRYLRAIEWIVATVRQPVVYYAHPREETSALRDLERVFGAEWFDVQPNTEDVASHVARHRYQCYIAAFSTALLDVAPFGPAAFCPALFGLTRVHRQLARLSFLPARLIRTWPALTQFSEDAQAQACAGGPSLGSRRDATAHEPAPEVAA